MQQSQFDETIRQLLHRKPFQPFVVTLRDGESVEVTRRFQLALGEGRTIAIIAGRPRGMFILKDEIVSVDLLEPAR